MVKVKDEEIYVFSTKNDAKTCKDALNYFLTLHIADGTAKFSIKNNKVIIKRFQEEDGL